MLTLLTVVITGSMTAPVPVMMDGGSLVINEIMVEPLKSASIEKGQWVELYNNSGEWINLSDWTLENQDGEVVVFSTIIIPPEGYFVVGASSVHSENGGYTPDAVWNGFTLSSQGSLSLLYDRTDEEEFFNWNETWDIYPGASLERINPGWAANDRESWCHSETCFGDGDLGTPGGQNSVFSDGFGQNTWAFIKAFVH